MIARMIMNNVLHRPIRTLITVIAVAVEVMLVIIVVGLTSGLVAESAKRIEGVGADIMVQPPSASVFMAFSGAPMPIRLGDKLAEMKYVQVGGAGAAAIQFDERARHYLRHRSEIFPRGFRRIRFSFGRRSGDAERYSRG